MKMTLKLAFIMCLMAVTIMAVPQEPHKTEKAAEFVDQGDDFPSNESVKIDDDNNDDGEERLHLLKKKPFALHALISKLIKPKPLKKDEDLKSDLAVITTQTVEVTRRVKTHPVCVTVYGDKPNCFKDVRPKEIDSVEGLYIEDTPEEIVPSSRSARYLSFAEPTPEIPEVKSEIEEGSIEHVDELGRFLFRKPPAKKVTLTSTLYVTRVQKVVDYKVTATLAVENCVPAYIDIPYCPKNEKNDPIITKLPLWKDEDTKEMLDLTDIPIENISQ